MSERAETSGERDYGCEIIALIVLVILSALSHFWLIAIAIGVAIAIWAAISMVGQLALSAINSRVRARQTSN